jgi:hypothetical protein
MKVLSRVTERVGGRAWPGIPTLFIHHPYSNLSVSVYTTLEAVW